MVNKMTTDTIINAANNPALANEIATKAMKSSDPVVASSGPKVTTTPPPDTDVELLGGLMDPIFGLISTAEVRELNGTDEELISKINDPGKALLTILERATVKIGEELADKETLDALYAGDRELLLLAIRKATFGSDIKLGPGECPSCGVEQTFEIDLNKDVPLKKLDGEPVFSVKCKVGNVVVSLPTGSTQKAIVTSTNKTSAELDSILLKNCIESINDNSVITLDEVRKLSLKDRRDILQEITTRNPGPQLSAIKIPCQSCGTEVPLPLTLAELFL
jgi:hypothetical protein